MKYASNTKEINNRSIRNLKIVEDINRNIKY